MTRSCEFCGTEAWTGVEVSAFRPDVDTFELLLCHGCFRRLEGGDLS